MQSSRDSSVLSTLAVAFGNGLAFGVGMKLSQRAASSSGAKEAPAGNLAHLMERILEIEKRLTESERAKASHAIAAGAPAFDQKVLEAVVTALDARLHEQAGRMESRITELDARLAIELQSLRHQDHSLAASAETRAEALKSFFNDQIALLRREAAEDRQAERGGSLVADFEKRLAVELQSLSRQDDAVEANLEKRIEELRSFFSDEVAALRREAEEDRQAERAERLLAELEQRLTIELQSLHRRDDAVEASIEKRIEELGSLFSDRIAALSRQIDEDRRAEHAESRVAELEAALAIELKSLRQQDHAVATSIQTHLEDLNANFNDQIAVLRRRPDEERQSIRREIVDMQREFAEEAAQAVERRVEEVAGRHAALLRAELEHKDDQIAELREVIVGFAQACRALTERPAPRAMAEPEPEPSNVQVLQDRRAG